jgi:hypothetical protein
VAPRLAFPCPAEQAAGVGIGEHRDQGIAILLRHAIEREEFGRRGVPRQDVPASAGQIGRLVEALDHPPHRRRHAFGRERAASGLARQRAQMPVLGLAQAKRAGQGVDRGDGRADRSPLFQAGVPVDADPRELGHLLAPQARCSPPLAVRQAQRRGAQPLAP